MKKLLLITVCIVTVSFTQAQSIEYGLRGGINLNTFRVTPELDPPSPTFRFGIHLGGLFRYNLSESIGLEANLLYATQGANDSDPDDKQISKLHYLNLPLLFRYKLDVGLNFVAGPKIGFLMGGNLLVEEKSTGEQDLYKATNFMNPIDFGLTFGVGYEFEFGLDLSARYNLGLSDINDDQFGIAIYEPNQKVKSSSIQISCGFNLN